MTVPPTTPPDNVGGGSIYGPAREVSDLFDVVEQSQGAELFKPHLSTVGDVEVLKVEDLTVGFPTEDGLVRAVRGVSYTLHEREVLGIVGESGSGKSVSSMAVMGLLPKSARITGKISFRGDSVLDM